MFRRCFLCVLGTKIIGPRSSVHKMTYGPNLWKYRVVVRVDIVVSFGGHLSVSFLVEHCGHNLIWFVFDKL